MVHKIILESYSETYSEIYYFEGLPLLCSGQSSWLQIQRSEFDSRLYQIF
jgi:hypothetical protein